MENKFMITSDVHIDDYDRFNIEPNFRMNQFRKLALRYVELGKENGTKTIILAGDIINKPVNPPTVSHLVADFFKILASHFEYIGFILGQHDLFSRKTLRGDDSMINLYNRYIDQLHYLDDISMEVGGRSIYFKNYAREVDLSHIKKKIDLFVGHITIDERFGQEVDNSKFKLGIFGDIHNSKVVDNMVCIGNPIQHNLGDQKDGTYVVYDATTGDYEIKPIDEDHTRFLRIFYTKNQDEEGLKEGTLDYYVYRKTEIKKDHKKGVDVVGENIKEVIKNYLKDIKLDKVHKDIEKDLDEPDRIVDFEFELENVHIINFRSIKELEIDFNKWY